MKDDSLASCRISDKTNVHGRLSMVRNLVPLPESYEFVRPRTMEIPTPGCFHKHKGATNGRVPASNLAKAKRDLQRPCRVATSERNDLDLSEVHHRERRSQVAVDWPGCFCRDSNLFCARAVSRSVLVYCA